MVIKWKRKKSEEWNGNNYGEKSISRGMRVVMFF
jgi:hypothetical protein